MRAILFRGMNKKGAWFYGCFIHTGCDAPAIIFGDGEQEEVIPETIGQYTGQTTFKEKLKIFEGDKVILFSPEFRFGIPTGFKGVVKFFECQWWVDDGKRAFPLFQSFGGWEIIGNIHEEK